MRGLSWVAEDLLASQESICYMDLITPYVEKLQGEELGDSESPQLTRDESTSKISHL
jgi:hypothetical protein